MSILDEFLKGTMNKSSVDTVRNIVSSMHLIDFGVITKQYSDGTCDVTCMKKVESGGLRKYHGVEILYPCGIKNVQVNQMCILVNPLSSVYRTTDIENPDFIENHDQRCIKAIPVSNAVTNIFAGIDIAGNFSVSNKGTCILLDKWSAYFGTCDRKNTGVLILNDGTVDISMNKGKMQMLIHPVDGLAFIHYGYNKKALEALVMKPDGEKINLFFCSELFTFTNISDILNSDLTWSRTEHTDLNGVLHIYTSATRSSPDRHVATSEDLKALWTAFKNHTHFLSWTDGSGEAYTAKPGAAIKNGSVYTDMPANPKQVAGIIVKDGDDA